MDGPTFAALATLAGTGFAGLFAALTLAYKGRLEDRDRQIAAQAVTEKEIRDELKAIAKDAAESSAKQLEAARGMAQTYADERKALLELLTSSRSKEAVS